MDFVRLVCPSKAYLFRFVQQPSGTTATRMYSQKYQWLDARVSLGDFSGLESTMELGRHRYLIASQIL